MQYKSCRTEKGGRGGSSWQGAADIQRMKYSFSRAQQFPFFIGILEIAFFIFLCLFEILKGERRLFIIIPCVLFSILGMVIIKVFSLAFCRVTVCSDKISIVTGGGKEKRSILWKDVKIYTCTADIQYGGQYICISSNKNLPHERTYFFGVVWAIYYDKSTIALPTSRELQKYCDKMLAPYGIERKYVQNPNLIQRNNHF